MNRSCEPKIRDVQHIFYPETSAGGFSSVDGTVQFYQRVNSILSKDDIIVDLGAGRGAAAYIDTSPYRLALRTLRGKCQKVIGIDVEDAVFGNPMVDEARLIGDDGLFPLENDSVNIIVADAVFEHISNTDRFVSEIQRVLRSGGWVCARTPNRWGYIGIGTNLIPKR
jgi:SAM-dependent methyltransferase